MEVVQTFDITSLSDIAAYRLWDFGNPAKIQGKTKNYHVPAPTKCQPYAYKIIVLCYLDSWMGYLDIPTEDFLRHKLFFLNRRR